MSMAELYAQVERIRKNPRNVPFNLLSRVCDHFFGCARQKGTSHRVYKTPWPGDPRVNIQNDKGKAKTYQVRQVLKAIDKIQNDNDASK